MRLRMAWQLPLSVALAALAVFALGLGPVTATALYVAAVAPELTRVDLTERRLPNMQVVPGVVVGVIAAAGSWLISLSSGGQPPLVPVIAGLAYGGFLLLLGLAGGVGMGDVKLAALLGLASPTIGVAVVSPFAAFLLGGVVSVVVLIRRGRGARIPFGPFLLAGYVVALVVSLVLGSGR